MSRVLIIGPGYIGAPLAIELNTRGHMVVTFSRSERRWENAITAIRGDVSKPDTLGSIPKDITHVVYAVSAGASDEQSYRRAYVDGVRNVVEALRELPLDRFIFVSSTGVYAQDDGSLVDELSPTEPDSFTGKCLLDGESIASGLGCSLALRLAGIYGPGRQRLVDSVRSGKPFGTDELRKYTNRIHQTDCVGAIAHLLFLRRPAPIYIGVDDEPAPLGEIVQWLGGRLGVETPTVDSLDDRALRGNKRCSNRRLKESGYAFQYPTFREGFAALL